MVPANILSTAADFIKLATIPYELPPCEYHGFAIRQSAICCFKNLVWNFRRFIEYIKTGRSSCMLAREALIVLLFTCLRSQLPIVLQLWVFVVNASGLNIKPSRRDARPTPSLNRCPCFFFQ